MKRAFFVLCLLIFLYPSRAAIPFIVAPNDSENVEGNSASGVPFHIGNNSIRYQQVFDSSQFTSFGPDPWRIEGISLRIDMRPWGGSSFGATLTNIQLNLSTTSAEPDSLSPVFALNVGADDTIVFSPGALEMTAGLSPFTEPQPFRAHIVFSQPFIYDPTRGNLLLDVRNFAGGDTTFFDAVDTTNDPVSSVWALSANALSGTLETKGLVVRFVANPIPEPGTLALFILGVVALAATVVRRRN
jgi:hypothetical protein